ncbi:hypothetical protein DFS34DRAFT_661543 [Phlyctochytrium arcticum]|nr:hypothetical protein DFS34DRAFT_661543 [Phlyctochytrium arcticum]
MCVSSTPQNAIYKASSRSQQLSPFQSLAKLPHTLYHNPSAICAVYLPARKCVQPLGADGRLGKGIVRRANSKATRISPPGLTDFRGADDGSEDAHDGDGRGREFRSLVVCIKSNLRWYFPSGFRHVPDAVAGATRAPGPSESGHFLTLRNCESTSSRTGLRGLYATPVKPICTASGALGLQGTKRIGNRDKIGLDVAFLWIK